MKIAILTSGILPVPAVQGGAVENLIDFYLEYNDQHRLHDITVYSVWHPDVKVHPALMSEVNHYIYIMVDSLVSKIRKAVYKKRHHNQYYHYTIEFFFEQALKHIRKERYDAIIVENRPGFVLKIKNKTAAIIVIHQENDYLNTQVRQHKEIYDATSLILNTSDYITNRVRSIAANDTKCKTVLNGIDTKRFYDANPQSRERVNLKKEDFVIVYSGRLTKEKGILELIKALVQLKNFPQLKLLIIGASFYGKDKTPNHFINELQNTAQIIRDNVIFTGFIDYNLIPSHLKMADIAVVPSMWDEPFGLTVVEAMAAGLPLITTRSGGIPEICEGVATIVDRSNVIDNLAKAILDLYQHSEKREQMAAASLQRSKLFDKETYARNFFKALELGTLTAQQ